jgi:hypothetical protein
MGIFDGLFNNDPQKAAAAAQTAGINSGLSTATNFYNTGNNFLNSNYAAGLSPFLSNYAAAQPGITAYGNATGANGPAGSAQATQAFWNNPGISAQLRMGNNAILARDQAGGTGASGNEAIDLANYNQGVTSQGWNNYVSALNPYLNFGTQSATGIGGLYSGLGNNLNTNEQNLANMYYGGLTSIGNANANADLATANNNANIFNGILSGAGAAVGMIPFLSDERVKEDVEPIGGLFDGQKLYRFRYVGDPQIHIGLMAQEVEDFEPEAVVELAPKGLLAVDYGKATDYAAHLGAFAA